MDPGPRESPRLRLRGVPRRQVIVLLLVLFCVIAGSLVAAGRLTSGSITVGVGESLALALSPAIASGPSSAPTTLRASSSAAGNGCAGASR